MYRSMYLKIDHLLQIWQKGISDYTSRIDGNIHIDTHARSQYYSAAVIFLMLVKSSILEGFAFLSRNIVNNEPVIVYKFLCRI